MRLSRTIPLLGALLGLAIATSTQEILQNEAHHRNPPSQNLQQAVVFAWPVSQSKAQSAPVPIATVEYVRPARNQHGRVCQAGDQDEALVDSHLPTKKTMPTVINYTPPAGLIEDPTVDLLRIGLGSSHGAEIAELSTSLASVKLFSPGVTVRIILVLDQAGNAWRAEVHPSPPSRFAQSLTSSDQESELPLTEKQIARLEAKKKKEAERRRIREEKLEERKRKLLEARKAAGVDLTEAAKKDAERAKKAEEKKKKNKSKGAVVEEETQLEVAVGKVQLSHCGPLPVLNPRVVITETGQPEGTPPEEKSWFQKYWWLIAAFTVTQLLGPMIREGIAPERSEGGEKEGPRG